MGTVCAANSAKADPLARLLAMKSALLSLAFALSLLTPGASAAEPPAEEAAAADMALRQVCAQELLESLVMITRHINGSQQAEQDIIALLLHTCDTLAYVLSSAAEDDAADSLGLSIDTLQALRLEWQKIADRHFYQSEELEANHAAWMVIISSLELDAYLAQESAAAPDSAEAEAAAEPTTPAS